MRFLTHLLFLVLSLVGRSSPQVTEDFILLTLESLAAMQHGLLQKFEGLEHKMTSVEDSIRELKESSEQSQKTLDERINQSHKTLEERINHSIRELKESSEQSHKTLEERINRVSATINNLLPDLNAVKSSVGSVDDKLILMSTNIGKSATTLEEKINGRMDNLTSTAEEMLRETLEEMLPQCLRPTNCKELLDRGKTMSGVYTITPKGFPEGVQVYCDQETDGGGWTVILQRQRQTQQLRFDRTFEEYAAGFGDPNGEFWIGNNIIHAMTGDEPFTLMVEAKNLQGESRTGIWNTFSLGSEDTQFTLSLDGYSSSSSTLGNALTRRSSGWTVNGMKFSTYDRDNDRWNSGHCSRELGRSGWWYNSCGRTSPTAPLGDADGNAQIASWAYWEKNSYGFIAISEIAFKIRP